jgi:2'-5' RNA ligase
MGTVTTTTTTIGAAIDIPEPWGSQLTRRRADAGDPVAAYISAHVTLLGPAEIAPADLPAVAAHLDDVAGGYPPFTIHLRGTGTFRPVTEVVFVAVAVGIGECEQLHEAMRAAPAIKRPEQFPYHPHVTVAQDVPAEALDAVFDDLAGFEATFPVSGFTLFEHVDDGRWRPYQEYRLTGRAARDRRR